MKIFNILLVSAVLAFMSTELWALKNIKHDAKSQQKILSINFDGENFEYIYERSLSYSYLSSRKYGVLINNQEIPLLIERKKNAIKQSGFINSKTQYKTVFLIDAVEKKIILGVLSNRKDKKFITKEINFLEEIRYINKVMSIKGGLVLIADNIWSSGVYFLDLKKDEIKKIVLEGNRGKRIVDYFYKDKKAYSLSLDESDKAFITIYNEDLSIHNKIVYSHKNKIIDAKFIDINSSFVSIALQDINKGLLSMNSKANLYQIKLNLLKSNSPDVDNLFSINLIDNSRVLDNLVYCKANEIFYWPERDKKAVEIKSNNKFKLSVNLPKDSIPREVLVSSELNKLNVVVNFMKYEGKYFNAGFGFDNISIDCQ